MAWRTSMSILQQIVVVLIEGDDAPAENFFQGYLIGLEGGVEVDQGFSKSRS